MQVTEEKLEKARQKAKAWHWANRERANAKSRAYYEANRERRKTRQRQYYAQNKEKILPAQAAYRRANLERSRALEKAWRERNHARVVANVKAYKARRRGAPGRYTGADIQRLFEQQWGACVYCMCSLHGFHVDHIQPLAKGGSNDVSNIQLLCRRCNIFKRDKDPVEIARLARSMQ